MLTNSAGTLPSNEARQPFIIDRALAAQLGWSSSEQAVDQTIYMASPWIDDTGYQCT